MGSTRQEEGDDRLRAGGSSTWGEGDVRVDDSTEGENQDRLESSAGGDHVRAGGDTRTYQGQPGQNPAASPARVEHTF